MVMTEEEKFKFDLEGYLVIKGVLTQEALAELNAIADERFPHSHPDSYNEGTVSAWGEPYKRLIDHPRIVPYLVELIEPKFRLDHDYCIFMSEGDTRRGLHGGPGHGGDHWYAYRDGVMRNGLTVVTYFLTDVPDGAGGFACVPGSHKTNFKDSLPEDVRSFDRVPHYVIQPTAAAGDVLLFTEALMHGTMPWRAKHERRALLYKYSPGHSTWAKEYYDLSLYGDLTEQQKRIMSTPAIQERAPVNQEG